jgi:hypothetical protein
MVRGSFPASGFGFVATAPGFGFVATAPGSVLSQRRRPHYVTIAIIIIIRSSLLLLLLVPNIWPASGQDSGRSSSNSSHRVEAVSRSSSLRSPSRGKRCVSIACRGAASASSCCCCLLLQQLAHTLTRPDPLQSPYCCAVVLLLVPPGRSLDHHHHHKG